MEGHWQSTSRFKCFVIMNILFVSYRISSMMHKQENGDWKKLSAADYL